MADGHQASWQVLMDDNTWSTLSEADSLALERQLASEPWACCDLPLGPSHWRYRVDLGAMTQMNTKTGRVRALRREGGLPALRGGRAPRFEDALAALRPFHRLLGGTPHAGRNDPHIPKKLKKAELEKSSDYEYVYMTILGFKALSEHGEEIARLNNGAFWRHNPGTMRLEEVCGFTMHGDREGANGIVRSAPDALLRAYAVARRKGIIMDFFQGEAFDRRADPCLEGRLGRILAFLEHHCPADEEGPEEPGAPPWEELALAPLPEDSSAERVVGEHLRVFRNTCIWDWAKASGQSYAQAKHLWEQAGAGQPSADNDASAGDVELPDVAACCNSSTFLEYLAAAGAVQGTPPAPGRAPPAHVLPPEAVRAAVLLYVDLGTLPPATAAEG